MLASKTVRRHVASSFPRRQFFAASAAPFKYEPLFQTTSTSNPGYVPTPWKKLTSDHVSTHTVNGKEYLQVENEGLRLLTQQAMEDVAHLLRPAHLQSLANILKDPEASDNDRFVTLSYLKNANIAASKVLPGCQDTGTGVIVAKRGHQVITEGNDEEAMSRGVYDTYSSRYLRYSQLAPLSMFKEVNTKNNLPAQIDVAAVPGNEYNFLYLAKGGGSANKTFLFQGTPGMLSDEDKFLEFLMEKVKSLGTAACPPYHLSIVIGGLSAELNLKTVKMASAKYYDALPPGGNALGRAFRDIEFEKKVQKGCEESGIGAQFGGKYFVHDVRVVRLPRHGASLPIGIGVSCSADRNVLGKITKEGIFIEQLEENPAKYLPEVEGDDLSGSIINVDINQPMEQLRKELSKHPVKTRLQLNGTIIVARDLAHIRMQQALKAGKGLPDYVKDHVLMYAGPAKTPEGYASGAFGPTTGGRMDAFVEEFQSNAGSMVMLAKGNRSRAVTRSCKKHGGFYLGSIGGAAANLAEDVIKKVECIDYEDLGMEAVWRMEVENFPAFIVVDDKGNDFFAQWQPAAS